MTDIAGNEIKPGSLIVYATTVGDSAALLWGRVERIKTVPSKYSHAGQPRPDEERITVRGIERWGPGGRPALRDRLTTLSAAERIVVIPWNSRIPDNIRQLLDPDGAFARNTGIVG